MKKLVRVLDTQFVWKVNVATKQGYCCVPLGELMRNALVVLPFVGICSHSNFLSHHSVLLRRLQCDPDLASVSHVFVDEVHER